MDEVKKVYNIYQIIENIHTLDCHNRIKCCFVAILTVVCSVYTVYMNSFIVYMFYADMLLHD